MGTITFVRHGQANSAAKNEADYDALSDLGKQQATWLGDWMREQGERFDLVLSGSLNRHQQTSASMGWEDPHIDPRLNEMDYFNLGKALEDHHGIPMPDPDGFATHVHQVMEAWQNAEIMGNETFASFETRVSGVLQEATQPGRHVLCVTSGGVIGMILRHLLDLDTQAFGRILLPIYNSSIHRVHVTPHGTLLAGYNATPHLDLPDRAFARTHY
jgi:broad specificity phosphatase PhoE